MKSVYCVVRTGSLNKAVCASSLKKLLHGPFRFTSRTVFSLPVPRPLLGQNGAAVPNVQDAYKAASFLYSPTHIFSKIGEIHYINLFQIRVKLILSVSRWTPSSSSSSSLSDDRFKASSKTIPPHIAVHSFLLQMTVSSSVLKVIQ